MSFPLYPPRQSRESNLGWSRIFMVFGSEERMKKGILKLSILLLFSIKHWLQCLPFFLSLEEFQVVLSGRAVTSSSHDSSVLCTFTVNSTYSKSESPGIPWHMNVFTAQNLFLFYVFECFACTNICACRVPGASRAQKTLDSFKLEL